MLYNVLYVWYSYIPTLLGCNKMGRQGGRDMYIKVHKDAAKPKKKGPLMEKIQAIGRGYVKEGEQGLYYV
jgi:hypothetical protein